MKSEKRSPALSSPRVNPKKRPVVWISLTSRNDLAAQRFEHLIDGLGCLLTGHQGRSLQRHKGDRENTIERSIINDYSEAAPVL